MAGTSPSELARTALQEIAVMRAEFEAFVRDADLGELRKPGERFATLEEKVAKLEAAVEQLKLLPVIEDKVNELKKAKEEADKRQWQVVYIDAGAVVSLLATVVVQLVLVPLKKP